MRKNRQVVKGYGPTGVSFMYTFEDFVKHSGSIDTNSLVYIESFEGDREPFRTDLPALAQIVFNRVNRVYIDEGVTLVILEDLEE